MLFCETQCNLSLIILIIKAMQHSREAVRRLTDILSKPTVLKGTLENWPSRHWSPEYLASVLKEKKVKIRIGPIAAKNLISVLWEVDCVHEEATLGQFCEWLSQDASTAGPEPSENPLLKYKREEHWCYVDYKQMAALFEGHPDILEAVHWADLGFSDRDGRQSTIWIGSDGAFTPGHYDTYGFNLVAQIYGRKRWHLFPPSQTHLLFPTRIPYEESSVFSPINISNPSLKRYSKFADATPYVVTLEPGDVLFVPEHWWHFVESLEVSISINTWVEAESDKESRIQEALTRVLVSFLMSDYSGPRKWVNPTERICDDEVNFHYLGEALQDCSHKSLQSITSQATCYSSEISWPSRTRQAVKIPDLPAHRPNLGCRLSADMGTGKKTTEMRDDGDPTAVTTSESSATCSLESDTKETSSTSDDARSDMVERLELEEEDVHGRDKVKDHAATGSGLKRPLLVHDVTQSSKQSKLPKTNPTHQSNPEQSVESLPDFIVPVACHGQVYKENQYMYSSSCGVKPDNIKGPNVQMRSESGINPNPSVNDVMLMVAECATHPAVVSLMTTLLHEKYDFKARFACNE